MEGKSPLQVVKPPGQGYGDTIPSRLSWNSSSFVWPPGCRIMQSYKQLCSQLPGITENTYFVFLERSLCICPLFLAHSSPLCPSHHDDELHPRSDWAKCAGQGVLAKTLGVWTDYCQKERQGTSLIPQRNALSRLSCGSAVCSKQMHGSEILTISKVLQNPGFVPAICTSEKHF